MKRRMIINPNDNRNTVLLGKKDGKYIYLSMSGRCYATARMRDGLTECGYWRDVMSAGLDEEFFHEKTGERLSLYDYACILAPCAVCSNEDYYRLSDPLTHIQTAFYANPGKVNSYRAQINAGEENE